MKWKKRYFQMESRYKLFRFIAGVCEECLFFNIQKTPP